jgi:hypothetical protein
MADEPEVTGGRKLGEPAALKWVTNEGQNFFPTGSKWGMTFDQWVEWRRQFVIGPPRATERFSVEELTAFGMVGLYRRRGRGIG